MFPFYVPLPFYDMHNVTDFYPSITEKLLTNGLKFSERILCIKEKEKQIISHARKSLLFNNVESWIKQGNKLFDVTIGAWWRRSLRTRRLYVHVKSNHLPNIIKQIPISIQNRLSNHSTNEEFFQRGNLPTSDSPLKCCSRKIRIQPQFRIQTNRKKPSAE